ncbi:phosphatase [Clostridium polyendosporum]|uniref:Phosphatase n=1 Tax=Clostridium polyendosporum TaxID=69208 RepID=A0A919VFH7_9CLOT|nr:Ppx/GppA phosphatase family protein [Clostridium polyendosporum]GIM30314.1 phosphatase [Clostridium polyendosporum]
MERIGVIGLDSNSIRVMLAEIEDSGYFKIIDELQESVRIGLDLIENSYISKEKIDKTIATLKSFKSLCTVSGASQIITIATEALNAAENKSELKERVLKELSLKIRILSFDEEIYYNHLGIKNSIYSDNSLMVDIRGSHTHVAWLKGKDLYKKFTMPVGCINISKMFKLEDTVHFLSSESANDYVEDLLKKNTWLFETKFDNIIGIGGTIRNLAKIDQRKKRYPIDTLHNYIFNDYDLNESYNLLKCKNLKGRLKINGLSIDRADVIVGGTIIIHKIVELLSINEIKVCGRGLREGIIHEYLNNNYASSQEDILDYSIHGIIETLNINKPHADNVYNITYKLFQALKPLHHLSDEYNNLIKTASLLHDCGISIRYYDHHLHSLYIILNSPISGLSHKELLLSALIAAMHRNNEYQIPLAKYSNIINRSDVNVVERIGVLLKIAEGLDRGLVGAVKDFQVNILENAVELNLFSDNDMALEIAQALRAKYKFKEVYNKELIVNKKL